MKVRRVQLNRFATGGDEICIFTEALQPTVAGMAPSRPGIDTVDFYAHVPRGTGIQFIRKVLAPDMNLQEFDVYIVNKKNQSTRTTHKIKKQKPKK